MVDKPLPLSPEMSLAPIHDFAVFSGHNTPLDNQPVRRISRLGPIDIAPASNAGPSNGSRYLYVAVRSGRRPGVYTDWQQAEVQLLVCLVLVDLPQVSIGVTDLLGPS